MGIIREISKLVVVLFQSREQKRIRIPSVFHSFLQEAEGTIEPFLTTSAQLWLQNAGKSVDILVPVQQIVGRWNSGNLVVGVARYKVGMTKSVIVQRSDRTA